MIITPDWNRLFPGHQHRHSMGLHRMEPGKFWNAWDRTGAVFRERLRWLQAAPELFQACLPDAQGARDEALKWIRSHADQPEPDWMLMSTAPGHEPRLIAGEVVFPSSWSLPDKMGLPVSSIHQPVPELEENLGTKIAAFLQKLAPGEGWGRENWGLAADGSLNHHPSLNVRQLDETASLETTWIRVEHQFLTRPGMTDNLLFGIRVSTHLMRDVAQDAHNRRGIRAALETMPGTVARYKGLHLARQPLITQLAALADSW